MAKLLSLLLFPTILLLAPAAEAFPGEGAYRALRLAEREATVAVGPGQYAYVWGEGACAAPIMRAADRVGAWEYSAAYDLSVYSSMAFVAQEKEEAVRKIISRLRVAARASRKPLFRQTLLAQARHIESLLRLPGTSACRTLGLWQEGGFHGLNEIANDVYGDMIFQNAFLPTWSSLLRYTDFLLPRMKRWIGWRRSEGLRRSAFYYTIEVWEDGFWEE